MARVSLLLVASVVGGCAPGRIDWGEDHDRLRTAMFVVDEDEHGEGYDAITMLLSTGELGCTLPNEATYADQALALLEWQTAICREGSRHLLVRLWHEVERPRAGRYLGDTEAAAGGSDAPERWATATYFAIDEAEADNGNSLNRTYDPEAVTYVPLAGRSAVVDVDAPRAQTLRGRFNFPDLHVSGRFDAEACTVDDAMLRELEPYFTSDPSVFCDWDNSSDAD